MKTLFFDTNIFIYISENNQPFAAEIAHIISSQKLKNHFFVTSAETIQEIIYLAKNQHNLPQGLKTSYKTLELADAIMPITQETCQIYLKMVKKYPNRTSRDLIQLSSCLENKIEIIITYDKDFKKFKEVNALTPDEFLAKLI